MAHSQAALSRWVSVATVAEVRDGDLLFRVKGAFLQFCAGVKDPVCTLVDTGALQPNELIAAPNDSRLARRRRRAETTLSTEPTAEAQAGVWIRQLPSDVGGPSKIGYCERVGRVSCREAKMPEEGLDVEQVLAAAHLRLPQLEDVIWLSVRNFRKKQLFGLLADSALVRCAASRTRPLPICQFVKGN